MAGKAVTSKKSAGKKQTKSPAKKTATKVRSAAKSIKGAVKKVAKTIATTVRKKLAPKKVAKAPPKAAPKPARTVRRETDIPFERIAQTYTPQQTSVKAGIRATGADHHKDQEFANGVDDERWNDEDVYTNKSGDPRIGTHGRAYEPGEKPRKSSKQ